MRAVVFVIILNVVGLTMCYPVGSVRSKSCNCINLTPEKREQIKDIENQISNLLLKLEKQFEDLDISDVTLNIKKYSEKDSDKEINLIVTVNDCVNNKKTDNRLENQTTTAENISNNDSSNNSDSNHDDKSFNVVETDDAKENNVVKDEKGVKENNVKGKPRMELVIVHLNEEEKKKVEDMEKIRGKTPFLMIQHNSGQREIKFF